MATSRRGAFRASLSPFGGGKLNLDDAYRVAEPVAPAPVAPPPAAAPPAAQPKAVKPKRPIAKKPVKKVARQPVRRAPTRVARKPAMRRPVAKRIPPPPSKAGLAAADRRRLGSGRAQPRRRTPPRPRVGAQRRIAEYG